MASEEAPNVKCIALGDGAVGKTCMLVSYTTNQFPGEYIPTVFDNYQKDIVINNQPITLHLWDTAGQEGFEEMRRLSYPHTNVVLLCFALDGDASFGNASEVWSKEINSHLRGVPVILVGTKSDLRQDPEALKKAHEGYIHLFTMEEGRRLATKIKADKYVECSSRTQKGLKEVFELAAILGLKNWQTQQEEGDKPKKKGGCAIL